MHEFVDGFCRICGEDLDWLAERMRERGHIGPDLPPDDNQPAFRLTFNLWEPIP